MTGEGKSLVTCQSPLLSHQVRNQPLNKASDNAWPYQQKMNDFSRHLTLLPVPRLRPLSVPEGVVPEPQHYQQKRRGLLFGTAAPLCIWRVWAVAALEPPGILHDFVYFWTEYTDKFSPSSQFT